MPQMIALVGLVQAGVVFWALAAQQRARSKPRGSDPDDTTTRRHQRHYHSHARHLFPILDRHEHQHLCAAGPQGAREHERVCRECPVQHSLADRHRGLDRRDALGPHRPQARARRLDGARRSRSVRPAEREWNRRLYLGRFSRTRTGRLDTGHLGHGAIPHSPWDGTDVRHGTRLYVHSPERSGASGQRHRGRSGRSPPTPF